MKPFFEKWNPKKTLKPADPAQLNRRLPDIPKEKMSTIPHEPAPKIPMPKDLFNGPISKEPTQKPPPAAGFQKFKKPLPSVENTLLATPPKPGTYVNINQEKSNESVDNSNYVNLNGRLTAVVKPYSPASNNNPALNNNSAFNNSPSSNNIPVPNINSTSNNSPAPNNCSEPNKRPWHINSTASNNRPEPNCKTWTKNSPAPNNRSAFNNSPSFNNTLAPNKRLAPNNSPAPNIVFAKNFLPSNKPSNAAQTNFKTPPPPPLKTNQQTLSNKSNDTVHQQDIKKVQSTPPIPMHAGAKITFPSNKSRLQQLRSPTTAQPDIPSYMRVIEDTDINEKSDNRIVANEAKVKSPRRMSYGLQDWMCRWCKSENEMVYVKCSSCHKKRSDAWRCKNCDRQYHTKYKECLECLTWMCTCQTQNLESAKICKNCKTIKTS